MLKTVDLSGKFDRAAPCVMLLGGFDGVHAGHRRLAERAKRYSLPVGIMTIGGGKGEKSLFTFSEREDIFKGLGLDFAFELPFSDPRAAARSVYRPFEKLLSARSFRLRKRFPLRVPRFRHARADRGVGRPRRDGGASLHRRGKGQLLLD